MIFKFLVKASGSSLKLIVMNAVVAVTAVRESLQHLDISLYPSKFKPSISLPTRPSIHHPVDSSAHLRLLGLFCWRYDQADFFDQSGSQEGTFLLDVLCKETRIKLAEICFLFLLSVASSPG